MSLLIFYSHHQSLYSVILYYYNVCLLPSQRYIILYLSLILMTDRRQACVLCLSQSLQLNSYWICTGPDELLKISTDYNLDELQLVLISSEMKRHIMYYFT